MDHLLDKSVAHFQVALGKCRIRDFLNARWEYLSSAEHLFLAAAASSGQLRNLRREQAERVVGVARDLEERWATQSAAGVEKETTADPEAENLLHELTHPPVTATATLPDDNRPSPTASSSPMPCVSERGRVWQAIRTSVAAFVRTSLGSTPTGRA